MLFLIFTKVKNYDIIIIESEERKMVYIKFHGGNGYCGCDYEEYMKFDDYNEAEFNQISYDLACENAESFQYCATGWEGDFETEEEREDYYNTALDEANWCEVSEEEYYEYCGD